MLRKVRAPVLTGIAALAVACVSFAAVRDTHTVKVGLPDGSTARIEYSGDVVPRLILAPLPGAIPVVLTDEFDSAPVSALDQVAAEMDRQAAAMILRAAPLQALPGSVQRKGDTVALGKLPAGTMHYELMSATGESPTCTRSVEMTSYGLDEKPSIVSTTSGDCRQLDRAPAPARLEEPFKPSIPGVTKPRMAGNISPAQSNTIV